MIMIAFWRAFGGALCGVRTFGVDDIVYPFLMVEVTSEHITGATCTFVERASLIKCSVAAV
ncbi:hypothetical protein PF006_g30739 [Phytophthora fragariae]|uniref:Secreted protein n=1 Tax=Phytophthora fragariae TaxID=53985 RepID=A0A6A3PSW5_9STRA|nr:hypothetical protein PF006_g30739 [Phytophthora fragariae]